MRRNIDGQTAFAYTRKRLGALVGKLRNRGGFLPPERELCEEIGVSRDTLKSVIEALVKEDLLEVRPRKGNYVKKCIPLNFRAGLIAGLEEMPFSGADKMLVISGAFDVFASTQMVGIHHMHPAELKDIAELARQYALDGILWINPETDCRKDFAEQLKSLEIPMLATIYSFTGATLYSNYVGLNHEEIGRVKASHLLARGCRKIAYVQGTNDVARDAFKNELASAGIPLNKKLLMPAELKALKEQLPTLLRKGEIDGIAAEGGDARIETLLAILNECSASNPEIIVDCGPEKLFNFKGNCRSKLFLNIMPIRELGTLAAECLLKAKGIANWRMEPKLLASKIIPSTSMRQSLAGTSLTKEARHETCIPC